MSQEKPSVFEYSKYREFLKDLFGYCKSIDRKYSHRFIAREIASKSSGWFADVLNGRINLSSKYIIKLARLFRLSDRELDFFEILVDYDQVKTAEEKDLLYKKIVSFNKKISATLVRKEQFSFYSKWYIPAVRELLSIYRFSNDYTSLAKKLDPPISLREAKHAIDVLTTCDLIAKDEYECYKPKSAIIKKDPAFQSLYWALYMSSNLDLAKEALYRYGKEKRDVSTVTVSLSQKGYDKAREYVAELRKNLLKLSEEEVLPEKVYQCNFQIFPLTK